MFWIYYFVSYVFYLVFERKWHRTVKDETIWVIISSLGEKNEIYWKPQKSSRNCTVNKYDVIDLFHPCQSDCRCMLKFKEKSSKWPPCYFQIWDKTWHFFCTVATRKYTKMNKIWNPPQINNLRHVLPSISSTLICFLHIYPCGVGITLFI